MSSAKEMANDSDRLVKEVKEGMRTGNYQDLYADLKTADPATVKQEIAMANKKLEEQGVLPHGVTIVGFDQPGSPDKNSVDLIDEHGTKIHAAFDSVEKGGEEKSLTYQQGNHVLTQNIDTQTGGVVSKDETSADTRIQTHTDYDPKTGNVSSIQENDEVFGKSRKDFDPETKKMTSLDETSNSGKAHLHEEYDRTTGNLKTRDGQKPDGTKVHQDYDPATGKLIQPVGATH